MKKNNFSKKIGVGVYLDNAASTPVDERVKKAMEPYFSEIFGNPGSIHSFGQEAQIGTDKARKQIADFLGCSTREIIFTGSATEANNLALKGIVWAAKNGRGKDFTPHVITTAFEHESVLDPCRQLEKSGLAEITVLPVSKDGFVNPEDVKKSLKENTVLVSAMYANNEIGTIQPISEIAGIIRDFRNRKSEILNPKFKTNSKFKIKNSKFGAVLPLLHTDAVQAVQFLDCGVEKLGVDLLSLSGQKIYGPKGVGALFVRSGVKIEPLVSGGMQEGGLRGGTENVPGIVGLGAAVESAAEGQKNGTPAKIAALRDRLVGGILSAGGGSAWGGKNVKNASLNGAKENRLPNNANILFRDASSEMLIIALDSEGVAVSAGSACSAKALKASHVLRAIGLSEKDASSSLRFTLSKHTTEEEIDYVLNVLPEITGKFKR